MRFLYPALGQRVIFELSLRDAASRTPRPGGVIGNNPPFYRWAENFHIKPFDRVTQIIMRYSQMLIRTAKEVPAEA
ncbi:MAG: hypothetical protein D3908_14815, partial [Candidatus Electrothrix sp. AUS4]|nr:hypothetical protein [Candidatus Electrothrix sp. AUS4]